jgi:hypothetical protein
MRWPGRPRTHLGWAWAWAAYRRARPPARRQWCCDLDRGGNLKGERQITLKLGDFLYLLSSEITTSVKGETGNGGNITIDPQFVVFNQISIIAQAIEGHGGNITINADDLDRPGDAESARGSISMAPAAQLLRNSYSAQTVCRNPAWSRVAEVACRRILTRRCRPLHRRPRYEPNLADAPRPAGDPTQQTTTCLTMHCSSLQPRFSPLEPNSRARACCQPLLVGTGH